MNTKTNPVNETQKGFIAKCIKRQNSKKFAHIRTVVLKALAVLAVSILFISFICLALHIAAYNQAKDQLETQTHIQSLKNGKQIEMTARVGGQHD
ncbi:hypothetical protein KTJ34_01575 [Acinetobacter courvalinii]|uniref:hypothetical protein n=1 Tax=Acinetobacter courvalinii TaxID=280147 RepID=UPI0021D028C4|nr:hypothetical protein [Acinetobacter courvalinii]MCU4576101.1 hypothetical protein [Acinetobacter courvalinii]